MYVCMYVCVYVCVHVCMHVCMYVYTYVYIYIFIDRHTYAYIEINVHFLLVAHNLHILIHNDKHICKTYTQVHI